MSDLLDGRLPPADQAQMEAHLGACPACTGELEALRATSRLLRSMPVPDGGDARERVLSRFRDQVARPVRAERTLTDPWLPAHRLGALAGAAAAAVALWLLVAPGPAPVTPPALPGDTGIAAAVGLPSASELDEMTLQHAAHGRSALDTSDQVQQDALSDTNARIEAVSDEQSSP